jgi:hypothetical protein
LIALCNDPKPSRDSAETDFIGRADNLATLDATPGKPHGKTVRVVVMARPAA